MVLNKKHSKRVVILLSLVLLVLLATGIIKNLQKPAIGIVNQPAPQDQVTAAANSTTAADGKYISFKYPSNFSASPASTPSGNQLEIFEYIKKPSPIWSLNIDVSQLPSGHLADDGSYNFRLANPAKYQRSTWTIKSQSITVFADQSAPYSKVAFMDHSNRVVSVSLTGNPSAESDLDTVLRSVLTSLEWK